MSILNYFGEILAWDLFTQGVFFAFILYLGGYLVFITHSKVEDSDSLGPYDLEKKSKAEWKGQGYFKDYFARLSFSLKNISTRRIDYKEAIRMLSPLAKSFLRFKLIFLPIAIIITFSLGIIVHTVSDSWIDDSNTVHVGLKWLWATDFSDYESKEDIIRCVDSNIEYDYSNFDNYCDTDQGIKLESFDKIYPRHDTICSKTKLQIYYNIKHKLLKDKTWREYINYSQILINLSQGIAFSFYVLLIISLINLVIYLGRKSHLIATAVNLTIISSFLFCVVFDKGCFITNILAWGIVFMGGLDLLIYKKRKMLIIQLFIWVSLIGYFASCLAWESNEREVCYKTYGLYKIFEPKVSYDEEDVLYQ